jgi:hypothetical protein
MAYPADASVGGISALQHCAAGKIDDLHPEDRLYLIDEGLDRFAATIDAIGSQLFHSVLL